MNVNIYKIDGSVSDETIDLPSSVFEVEPNEHLIYQAVRTYLSNKRQGTHKTKERSEVSGGGKKPWKQKGRGTARSGTSRSPVWVGGGTAHGPKPHKYTLKMTQKSSQLARKSALSIKAKAGDIMVLEDVTFETPKTKDFLGILKNLKVDGKKTLMLVTQENKNIYLSGRNINKVNIKNAVDVPTYDLVDNQVIIIQKSAVEKLCKPLIK
jgi:large subunit ribosomal protein L4